MELMKGLRRLSQIAIEQTSLCWTMGREEPIWVLIYVKFLEIANAQVLFSLLCHVYPLLPGNAHFLIVFFALVTPSISVSMQNKIQFNSSSLALLNQIFCVLSFLEVANLYWNLLQFRYQLWLSLTTWISVKLVSYTANFKEKELGGTISVAMWWIQRLLTAIPQYTAICHIPASSRWSSGSQVIWEEARR